MSSVRPEKALRTTPVQNIPEDMPERLKEIVIKKQSLLEQIWKDQRNMIQYERSYLTACSYGNVLRGVCILRLVEVIASVLNCEDASPCSSCLQQLMSLCHAGYTPVQAEIPFEGVSQCKFSLSCTRMRWYVAKCAELNNRVKEDLKSFKEQLSQPKRQPQIGARLQDEPLGNTAFNSSMQTSTAHGASAIPPKRLSGMGQGGYYDLSLIHI